ncbi:MAG: ABC transporter permease subunit [Lachnospiraceae bacterium]|nr:ABC transporter permease subunit [Lachnospiraceae bacterium]
MNYFFDFPYALPVDVTSIDSAVRNFSIKHEAFFSAIKGGLNGFIGFLENFLNFIPWWLLLLIVFIGGYKISKKLSKAFVYTAMLLIIGLFGLWDKMNETLAIVLASVIISLILGLPVGVLISGSDRADMIVHPILDTMQTMPIFVYLIPALLFFGLGKVPSVVATTIYAIVPVIRLTSHGIRQVDEEVVEAAKAFGSTKFQTLIKVQIPQAMPTIMAGVNQTLMMAMAMVVTCSMIGANGLGMEVLIGVNRMEIGRGLIAGIAVVILAILLDRFTQALQRTDGRGTNGGDKK